MDKEDDPKLEAYFPVRAFSRYLMAKGFGGVAYRSTRMALMVYKENVLLFSMWKMQHILTVRWKYMSISRMDASL